MISAVVMTAAEPGRPRRGCKRRRIQRILCKASRIDGIRNEPLWQGVGNEQHGKQQADKRCQQRGAHQSLYTPFGMMTELERLWPPPVAVDSMMMSPV
jgi:hypothetical protein